MRSSADFSRAMRSGRRTSVSGLVLYHLEDGASKVPRVGFAVGRALGSAVVRNRIRRRLREAIRPLLPSLKGCDLVVVARQGAADAPPADLACSVKDALCAAGLISTDPGEALGGTMEIQDPSPDVTEGTSS